MVCQDSSHGPCTIHKLQWCLHFNWRRILKLAPWTQGLHIGKNINCATRIYPKLQLSRLNPEQNCLISCPVSRKLMWVHCQTTFEAFIAFYCWKLSLNYLMFHWERFFLFLFLFKSTERKGQQQGNTVCVKGFRGIYWQKCNI